MFFYNKRGVFGIKSKLNINENDINRISYEKIILQALDTKHKALQSLYSTIHEDEFKLTKFILRNKLILNLQKQFDRIDEHVKSHIYFKSNDLNYYDVPLEMEVLKRAEAIMSVQIEDVKNLLKRILNGKSTVFHLGIYNCKLPEKF